MNEAIAQRLATVIKHNGSALLEDRASLLRLLAPGVTEYPPEVDALMLMLDTEAVAHLFKWAKLQGAEKPTYEQLRDHMARKYAKAGKLSAETAAWALDAWMHAVPELHLAATTARAQSFELEALAPPPPPPPPAVEAAAISPSSASRPAPISTTAAPLEDEPAQVNDEGAHSSHFNAPHFIENGHSLSAGRGGAWLKEGWQLFAAAPLIWWVCLILTMGLSMLLQVVPFIGQLASMFLSPILYVGLMIGAHELQQGEPLRVGHAFAGFKGPIGPLLLLTVVLVGLFVAAIAIVSVIFGSALMNAAATIAMVAQGGSTGLPTSSIVGLGGALVLFALLIAPLIAASYFAPTLIALEGQGVLAALKMSFFGSMKNVMPFLVYSVLFLLAAIVATLPFGLGWLILMPVLVTSMYAAYRDIFYSNA